MRIRLENPILDEFFRLISESKDFLSWSQISKNISCSKWNLGKIRHHKRTFPEKVFKELLEFIEPRKRAFFKNNAEPLDEKWGLRKRWDKEFSKLIQSINKKKNHYYSKLKASLCGYLAGDGSLTKSLNKSRKNFHYYVRFYPDDLEMAENIDNAFYKLYNKRLKIVKHKPYNCYLLQSGNKVVYYDLIKIGTFGTLDWRVPFDFLKTNHMKIEWLRAFFDSEAFVGDRTIQVQSVNKNGLNDIKKLLLDFGVETTKIYEYKRKNKNWNINYLLNICGKENLKNYLKLVSFTHSIKRKKLETICAGVAESG